MKKFKLGQRVRDLVTGFEGVATSRVEYINGCVQYGVTPKVSKDDKTKYPDSTYVDVDQLEKVKDAVKIKTSPLGGVRKDMPRSQNKL